MRRLGNTVKKRGRPITGRDPLVTVRLPRSLIEILDLEASIYEMSRSERIRARLEEIGMPLGSDSHTRTRTAYHEAGHAVVAHIMGVEVLKVTVQKTRTTRGRCHHDFLDPATMYVGDNHDLISPEYAAIMILLAGRASESILLGFDSDGGERGDLKSIGEELDRLGATDRDKLKAELYEKAESLVYRHRDMIKRVARRLMKVKTVKAEEFARLVA